MLNIPIGVARQATSTTVVQVVEAYDQEPMKRQGDVVSLGSREVSDTVLADLAEAAKAASHGQYEKAITAIMSNRAGKPRSSPSRWAMSECLLAYVNREIIDGWLYFEDPVLEFVQPMRVLDIVEDYNGRFDILGEVIDVTGSANHSVRRFTTDKTRGIPERVLDSLWLKHETPELRETYTKQAEHAMELVDSGDGLQCLATSKVLTMKVFHEEWIDQEWRQREITSPKKLIDRKVVVESTLEGRPEIEEKVHLGIEGDSQGLYPAEVPHPDDTEDQERVPMGLFARVFDLSGEEEYVVPTSHMSRYIYDPRVRDRLVLPATHARIIDTLTSSTNSALSDVVHGKSMGNLILCKGQPGMGKTLTAEVISEVLERPLYVVDASSIIQPQKQGPYGMVAMPLRERLEQIYTRVRRWDAVLLFDEADVVLGGRGNDLERNKVTAELLRSLENFERLAFLTTNRPDDVDDAIVSRCVAILEYVSPTGDDAVHAWVSLGDLIGRGSITEAMAVELVAEFPGIPPRDIKQLLNLAHQVAAGEGRTVDVGLICELAVFRSHTPLSSTG